VKNDRQAIKQTLNIVHTHVMLIRALFYQAIVFVFKICGLEFKLFVMKKIEYHLNIFPLTLSVGLNAATKIF
jgi:hypothetical protein